MAAAVTRLLDGRGRTAGTPRGHGCRGRAPADLSADRAVPLHQYGLDRGRGRAAHGRGTRPRRHRARGGRLRARLPRVRLDPARGTGPGRRGQRGAEQGRGPARPGGSRPPPAGLPPGPDRPEHLRCPQSARAAYRRAHAGATAQGDELLLSFTWRHLASLALREGELAEARHGFAESLRIREELGYLVGTAPALLSLADAETEPEAGRLRAEAGRLFRLLGGVPTWLAPGSSHRPRRPWRPTDARGRCAVPGRGRRTVSPRRP